MFSVMLFKPIQLHSTDIYRMQPYGFKNIINICLNSFPFLKKIQNFVQTKTAFNFGLEKL